MLCRVFFFFKDFFINVLIVFFFKIKKNMDQF